MDGIEREIAIMKKVHHPNVLCLYEVMDDPKVRCKDSVSINKAHEGLEYIGRAIVSGEEYRNLPTILHLVRLCVR